MNAKLHRIGEGELRIAVIDGLLGSVEPILSLASRLAPFPPAANYYPGLRRVIAADEPANAYVEAVMNAAAPYIAGAFDRMRFHVVEASFSMVTREPGALDPPQRAPHFDSTDPDYLAVLHYLHVPGGGGTGFFRQRSTGIEQVTAGNAGRCVATALAEAREQMPDAGYVVGEDRHFEQLLAVEAVPDRLVIYPGSALHSGLIPPTVPLSADPRVGRLTGNFFVQLDAAA